MMKPSDAFLGVIDFFATLIPGVIASFLVMQQDWVHPPRNWPPIERGSPEGWVVFLVASFVLGHATGAVSSACLDPIYDQVYARWRRASLRFVRSSLGKKASPCRVLKYRFLHVIKQTNLDDELLQAAKTLKKEQLDKLARRAGIEVDQISNTFWWAGTVVRATSSAGASEIDSLSAQSKLFRSITVLMPFAALWVGSVNPLAIAGWIIALSMSMWRFMRLRWDATERTYEYYIATRVLQIGTKVEHTA
jgi:hypothetical protein